MANILLINTHEYSEYSEGKLSTSLVEKGREMLTEKGYDTRLTTMKQQWDIQEELDKHTWANVIFVQIPVNWMCWPWSFKKYMDEVYTAGMQGTLCQFDGRTRSDPSRQYGTGGLLTSTRYMLSLTFNAPREAFDDISQTFFEGRSVDDLFLPMHLNFKFFGMKPMPTFACFDVMKNPDIEGDFKRFEAHIEQHF